jgi:peroxiredoxin
VAVRFLLLAVLALSACRHEPVLNPGKGKPTNATPGARDVTQNMAQPGTVTTRSGGSVDLATLWQDHRVVLVFYRGHWCPHCQKQLGELDQHKEEIAAQQAIVVGISSDTPEDAEHLHAKLGLSFEVYSDPQLAVITKWGVDDYGKGISLPATFVVEQGGAISYRKVGDKPSDHPSIDELLAAMKR